MDMKWEQWTCGCNNGYSKQTRHLPYILYLVNEMKALNLVLFKIYSNLLIKHTRKFSKTIPDAKHLSHFRLSLIKICVLFSVEHSTKRTYNNNNLSAYLIVTHSIVIYTIANKMLKNIAHHPSRTSSNCNINNWFMIWLNENLIDPTYFFVYLFARNSSPLPVLGEKWMNNNFFLWYQLYFRMI